MTLQYIRQNTSIRMDPLVWWCLKGKSYAWGLTTGLYLGILESSTCTALFDKTLTVNGSPNQSRAMLNNIRATTPHRSNYNGTKIPPTDIWKTNNQFMSSGEIALLKSRCCRTSPACDDQSRPSTISSLPCSFS